MLKIDKKKIISFIAMLIVLIIMILNRKSTKNNYSQVNFNSVISNSQNEIPENEIIINTETEEKIKIHITGEVNNPGIVELNAGDRICDAIELAGGLTSNADTSKTNLAYILSDGEKIYIPSFNDDMSEISKTSSNGDISGISKQKININTATAEELQNISGVGESTANAIIEYRTENGKFSSVEEIQNVSGIGESKFEKMKDLITTK